VKKAVIISINARSCLDPSPSGVFSRFSSAYVALMGCLPGVMPLR
jgi:hypothetical protein